MPHVALFSCFVYQVGQCLLKLFSDVNSNLLIPAGGLKVILRLFRSFSTLAWRKSSWYLPPLVQLAENEKTTGMFTKFCKFEVAEDWYNALSVGKILHMQTHLTHVGKSVITTNKKVLNGDRPATVLASTEQCLIMVNLATRKPQPLPVTLKERVGSLPKPQLFSLNFDVPVDVPIYSRSIKVEESHVDSNGHVNLYVYHHLILACVENALKAGLVVKDNYYVKEFACVHDGEALIGETMRVDVWQVNENKIHILLTKSEHRLVLATLLFHDTKSHRAFAKVASSL